MPITYKKANIPKAVREQVWLREFGRVYDHSCHVRWCQNMISVFDFQVGHDQPESKGGTLDLDNLRPICARCNASMSDTYTIQEWQELGKEHKSHWFWCWFC
jgi:hypothetical protein